VWTIGSRRWLTVTIIVLTILFVMCGCASSQMSAGPSCVAPGVTDSQVKAGLLYSATGSSADLVLPFRAGVDGRLGVANAAGGINGRQIAYTWSDDQSDSGTNAARARDLVETDDVFGIMESTTVATGSADYLRSHDIPVTGTSPEPVWGSHYNMFNYSNYIADSSAVSTWGDFAEAQGGHVAVLLDTSFSSTSMSVAHELNQSLAAAGVRVADTIDVGLGAIDVAATTAVLRRTGADTLVGAVTANSFNRVASAARAAGIRLRVALSPTGYDQRALTQWGAAIAGNYYSVDSAPFELDSPAQRQFLADMATYAPQLIAPEQQAALAGWIAADMFLRGLSAAGACPSRAAFISGLRAVHSYNAGGLLSGPIDLANNFRELSLCYTFLRVSADGRRFEVVAPAPRCGRRVS
jgi:branched-chain amino acid transport system substrate-binding protein